MILDELRLGNWLQSEDGQKKRNRPKPVSPLAKKDTKMGHIPDGVSQDQVMALLARLAPQPEEVNSNGN
jgi:hypothetical protein